jgi:hypothetical protein
MKKEGCFVTETGVFCGERLYFIFENEGGFEMDVGFNRMENGLNRRVFWIHKGKCCFL